ncbi:MAG: chemotaxis protein CheD [Alphaproteobacteria bacterium]|nr:chemotaxis protein CheD [Alphaproteobacteria bacterium]
MNTQIDQSSTERRFVGNHDAYFNAASDESANALYLDPGQVLFSDKSDQMIVATLGAGVLISVYDVDMHIGACGYVLLPEEILQAFPNFDDVDPQLLQTAFKPIEDCIGAMKRKGSGKNRIRIRLNGGAQIQGDPEDKGTKIYVFVREYLTRKGLSIMNEDLGGHYVRRVHFFPTTGRSVRWMLRRDHDYEDVLSEEMRFQEKIAIDQ